MRLAGGAGRAVGRLASLRPAAAICLAALLILLPELIVGLSYTDSFRYNFVWTEQFTRQFAAGDPYPRWLDGSWDGFGSPAFYFYPPLFFWVASVARVASFGALDAGTSASIATLLVLAASGLAMRAWLALHAGPRAATVGALAYMAAPYHLYDILCRGALAEACGYALLPAIMLAIRRIAEGREGHVVPLALAYGGLLLSHLPIALLASATAIPLYVGWCAIPSTAGRGRFALLCLFAGVAGIGLAAVYWLPALTLIPHIAADALGGAYYTPDSWFWWRPGSWPDRYRAVTVIAITAGAVLLAVAGATAARKREAGFWCGMALLGLVLISGLAPFLWRLPFLAQVQFPWRMLVIVEFATVTALAIGRPPLRAPLLLAGVLSLGVGVTQIVRLAGAMTAQSWREGAEARAFLAIHLAEAPEYLPRGHPIPLDDKRRADPDGVAIPAMPLAWSPDSAVRLSASEAGEGGISVTVDSPREAVVVARRFAFPRWRVTDERGKIAAPLTAWGRDRLVSWKVRPGRAVYRLTAVRLPQERVGLAISLSAALLIGAFGAFRRSGRSALKTCSPLADNGRIDGQDG